ncbi:MAG: hypothetical protein HW402_170 [Dehalococcoidales bacterium]|nr:hypothetical protein [Dehalococcoidales bacterium]
MRKYQGGESVPRGIYLNLSTWEYSQLYGEKRVLPASQGKYIKVPAVLAVVTGPFAGLVFIIFLPLVGIVGIVSFLAYKTGQVALVLGRKALPPVMVGWKPGIAFLTRKSIPRESKSKEELSKKLDGMTINEIAEEIKRRRHDGEP